MGMVVQKSTQSIRNNRPGAYYTLLSSNRVSIKKCRDAHCLLFPTTLVWVLFLPTSQFLDSLL